LQEINETPSDHAEDEWAWRVKMPGTGFLPKPKDKDEQIYTLHEEPDADSLEDKKPIKIDCNCKIKQSDRCSLCQGKI